MTKQVTLLASLVATLALLLSMVRGVIIFWHCFLTEQVILFTILIVTLVLFVHGRWRYDLVALLALLSATLIGLVPAKNAFTGLGHPAVVTVAAVLVVTRALINSGAVDMITRGLLSKIGNQTIIQVGVLTGLVAVTSSIMNNVGALALFMPIAIQIARKRSKSPSALLMPIAFGSLLGGLITEIGTPPNLIIATSRPDEPFKMFDFLPVGLGISAIGVVYITLVGWRLIPQRQGEAAKDEMFHIKDYTTELRVTPGSAVVNKPLSELKLSEENEVVVIALIRDGQRILAPSSYEVLQPEDILIVEADSKTLEEVVKASGLELVGNKKSQKNQVGVEDINVTEVIVTANSPLRGKTARNVDLRGRYGMNLVAVSREGERLVKRLGSIRFRPGDVLLLQGRPESMQNLMTNLGCLPLAERGVRLGQPQRVAQAFGIFGIAIAAAATGWVPVQISFVTAAVVMVLTGMLSLREAYDSINWPVIILLGAMIPVGRALETTGGAATIADFLLGISGQMPLAVLLAVLMMVTMVLSNIVNNAAAAILMAPIAISLSSELGITPDSFLMGVAVGASSAFLTPIGHQSNTLVLGPGGYRFGDYWKMGLPLTILVLLVSIPLILSIWGPNGTQT